MGQGDHVLWILGTLLAVWLMVVAATTVWVLACWRQGRRARAGRKLDQPRAQTSPQPVTGSRCSPRVSGEPSWSPVARITSS